MQGTLSPRAAPAVDAAVQQRRRAISLFVQSNAPLKKTWDWIRESSRPIRIFVKKRLGVNVTDAG